MFSNLLNETKDFKYQITVNVLFKKYTPNGEIEFAPVYFDSLTKTTINNRLLFKKLYTGLIVGLMEDLGGLLNQLNHNKLMFQLMGNY